jgi:hypothetical protein
MTINMHEDAWISSIMPSGWSATQSNHSCEPLELHKVTTCAPALLLWDFLLMLPVNSRAHVQHLAMQRTCYTSVLPIYLFERNVLCGMQRLVHLATLREKALQRLGQLDAVKVALTERKATQQGRLLAALDARLSSAHAEVEPHRCAAAQYTACCDVHC